MSATINGITCNPERAERVYDSIASGPGVYRRFDEVLYRNTEGFYFVVRPLDPDEARDWLSDPRNDDILARQLFPDEN